MSAQILHSAIEKVAPIYGISIEDINNKQTWRIDFKPEASAEERTSAQNTLLAFDIKNFSPRRLIPKSQVISRLTDTQVEKAISIMTAKQRERWRAPDKPCVYADDPEVLAILQAVGADPKFVLGE